eukprot:Phypoly_transcript_19009.p1 GENE.Phypoly_transcript_19009~~Phypoly_transcript_19009.p1  ORF type:complete len:234 (+),score=34.13 Phypoly_transcript_19009:21-722(+)
MPQMNKALGLFQSMRPAFFSISYMSILVAHALAYKLHGTFRLGDFLESSVALVLGHACGNLTNSYFDWKYGLDKRETSADRSIFDFGVSPKELMALMVGCYVVGALVVLDLLIKTEWKVLPLVLLGASLSFFYTAGPLKLKYHALGDVTIFLCFGPLTVWGYYIQLRHWVLEAFVYGMPVGFLAVAVLLANNTRDIELDKKGLQVDKYLQKYRTVWAFVFCSNVYRDNAGLKK